MPARPIFLVTKIKNVRRKNPANRFTGMSDTSDLFNVHFKHGYFPGVSMDFYFTDKNEADEFNAWQIYDPSQILANVQSREPYTVESVEKSWWRPPTEEYSEPVQAQESWIVLLESARSDHEGAKKGGHPRGKGIKLRFPTEAEASRYKKSRDYTPQDILGTLPALPIDISNQLQDVADQARQAQDQAQAQGASDAGAQLAADQLAAYILGHPPQPTGPSTVARGYTGQFYTLYLASGASGAYDPVAGVNTGISGIAAWSIANGGAAGNYSNAIAPFTTVQTQELEPGVFPGPPGSPYYGTVLTHYNAGTFNRPANGIFYGAFVPD